MACIGSSTRPSTRTARGTVKGNGPENLAILRHLALNLLRKSTLNRPIRRKIKLAGRDDAFLAETLAQMR